jgi:hypothetical protein
VGINDRIRSKLARTAGQDLMVDEKGRISRLKISGLNVSGL